VEEPALTLSELLGQAAAAAGLGDRAEAERLYRRATERSPGNSQAWLGLAAAVEAPQEKRACYERALAINPASAEAKAALQRLAAQGDSQQAGEIQATLAAAAAKAAALPPLPVSPTAAAPAEGTAEAPSAPADVLVCANHPETETTLRCNRCGRPVCVKCVKLTDVGYRCKDCIREQQGVYFNAELKDYFVVAIVSFVLAAIAAPILELLLGILGLFFGIILAVLAGPAVGGVAATIIRRSVGRRRGRYMGIVAVVAIILGIAIGALVAAPFGVRVNLIPLAIFLFTSLSTIYATLR
jgi:tetratricopeptide (TPR) repeat protein